MMKQRQVSNSILCSSIYIVLSARRRRRARQHNSRSVEMQRLAPPRRAPADTQRKRANAFDEQRAEQARRSPTRAGRRWRRRRRRARAPVARRSTDANNARRHGACRPARRSPTRQSNAPVCRRATRQPSKSLANARQPASAAEAARPSVGSTGCNDGRRRRRRPAGRRPRSPARPRQRTNTAPRKRAEQARRQRAPISPTATTTHAARRGRRFSSRATTGAPARSPVGHQRSQKAARQRTTIGA